ncbi:PilZ domain-containing protein [Blastochloris sulfoviridis]|nr:PilZ domain-containing protein [Blastochloris sulfoviridis]
MSEDRRRHPRLRSLIGGRIIFNDGRSTLDCVLRNISPGGALIACSAAVSLPEIFDLLLPSKNRRLRVRLVWRHEDQLGIATLSPVPSW